MTASPIAFPFTAHIGPPPVATAATAVRAAIDGALAARGKAHVVIGTDAVALAVLEAIGQGDLSSWKHVTCWLVADGPGGPAAAAVRARLPGVRCIGPRVEPDALAACASHYAYELEGLPAGKREGDGPTADLVLLGIDASWAELDEAGRLAPPDRLAWPTTTGKVTIAMPVLRAARERILVVTDADSGELGRDLVRYFNAPEGTKPAAFVGVLDGRGPVRLFA